MKWKIITDTACDLPQLDNGEIGFQRIPFVISIDNTNYVDSDTLDIEDIVSKMEKSEEVCHTACPGPGSWEEAFEDAEYVFAITISSQLSGSFNSAVIGANMALEKDPERKIHVFDSRSTGPEMTMLVHKIVEWIDEGLSYEDICVKGQQYLDETHLLFALSTFGNLVKNGRMPKIVGFVVGKLRITLVGFASDAGTIEVVGKARGDGQIVKKIVNEMKAHNFNGNVVSICHVMNEKLALRLKDAITKEWSAPVEIMQASGLDSFYAERKGIIIGFH